MKLASRRLLLRCVAAPSCRALTARGGARGRARRRRRQRRDHPRDRARAVRGAAVSRRPIPRRAEGKKQWDETKRKALDAMIDGKLVQQQATELKLSVTTDEVDRAIAAGQGAEQARRRHLHRGAQAAGLHDGGLSQEPAQADPRAQGGQHRGALARHRQRRRGARPTTSRTRSWSAGDDSRTCGRSWSPCRPTPSDADVTSARSASPRRWSSWRATAPASASWPSSTPTTTAPRPRGGDLGWVGKGVLVDALDDAHAGDGAGRRARADSHRARLGGAAAGRAQGGRHASRSTRSRSSCASSSTISRSRRRSSRGSRELRKRAHVDIRCAA